MLAALLETTDMGRMHSEWYKDRARELIEKPRVDHGTPATEIDPVAEAQPGTGASGVLTVIPPYSLVSSGTAPGAWVMAWVWIPDPNTEQTDGKATQATPDQGQGSS